MNLKEVFQMEYKIF
jgi:hypothetical protein